MYFILTLNLELEMIVKFLDFSGHGVSDEKTPYGVVIGKVSGVKLLIIVVIIVSFIWLHLDSKIQFPNCRVSFSKN